MAKKTEAYVDTSALIAFLDKSDTYHKLFARLFASPPTLITTSLVINEGHAWFLRRYDIQRAIEFICFIEDFLKHMSIYPIGLKELNESYTYIRKFSDQKLTLADAVGLNLMASEKIKECWSTDHHLGFTGATLIINKN